MKNLLQRTISGIVYLVIVIGSLLLGRYTFGAVFLVAGWVALAEFYRLLGLPRLSLGTVTGHIAGTVIFVLAFLTASRLIPLHYLVLTSALPVGAFIVSLYSKKGNYPDVLARTLLGVVYIFIPLALICYIVFLPADGNVYSYRILLGILILVWVNDTGAYITGTTMGSHKLFPRISPKKSWEGLAGGSILTLISAFWMDRITGLLFVSDWIVLALIVSVFGVYGDLTESWIKRKADKKDSGDLIPGHGGVLDRFDSILFVVPVSLIYLVFRGL